MVDRGNLQYVNDLYAEMNVIQEGMKRLDAGGRIVMMLISAPDDSEGGGVLAQVPTRTIAYPPQMVEGIKQQLTQRLHEIEDELANLGLTGVEPGPRAAKRR